MTREYQQLLADTWAHGAKGPEDTREVIGLTLRYKDVRYTRPRFSWHLAREMIRQIIAGEYDLQRLEKSAAGFRMDLWEAHPWEGEILGREWRTLKSQLDTRRAVINFPPEYCWATLHLLRRGGVIHGLLYQRSCDLLYGLPYDSFELIGLAKEFGPIGTLTHHIGSAHIYERDEGLLMETLGRSPSQRPQ